LQQVTGPLSQPVLLFSFVPPKTNTQGDSKCVDKVVLILFLLSIKLYTISHVLHIIF
jgi:hypothetical protein